MLCDRCKKNVASNYYKQNINGKIYEYNLCNECVKNISNVNIFLDDLLGSLLYSDGDINLTNKLDIRCEKCNSTIEDIRRCGRVGCSNCYKKFRNELMPSIQKIHTSIKHIGEIPSSFTPNPSSTITNLESKLSNAIKNQEFELAAKIRDQINELKKLSDDNE